MDLSFYKNKKVLLTGHTGFKGSWMCRMLSLSGADVKGYSLKSPTNPALFDLAQISDDINSIEGDIRDLDLLYKTFEEFKPEIVIHMAAQPIVSEGYHDPAYTYSANVMGTVNVLECIRNFPSVKSFVNVTTDKVYRNESRILQNADKDLEIKTDDKERYGIKIFKEDDILDGFDPYSNSKSCSELVTATYRRSFFEDKGCAISTARSGNVIGGGDFAKGRIISDCMKAALGGGKIMIKNPASKRPYQHVLEALYGYLLIAKCQVEDKKYAGAYNIGPDRGAVTNEEIVRIFCDKYNNRCKEEDKKIFYETGHGSGINEAHTLELSADKIKKDLGWQEKWSLEQAVLEIVDFIEVYKSFGQAEKIKEHMDKWIRIYLG